MDIFIYLYIYLYILDMDIQKYTSENLIFLKKLNFFYFF